MKHKLVVVAAAVMVALSYLSENHPVATHVAQFESSNGGGYPQTAYAPGGQGGWFSGMIGSLFGSWAGGAVRRMLN